MHHHPFAYKYPHVGNDVSQIREGAEFVELVEKHGVDLVIHGHRHHPKVQTRLPNGGRPITFFCAGSLSVNADGRSNGEIPNTIHFIDVDKDKDYFVLRNYSYTGPKGWHTMNNDIITPLDGVMKIGKVFSEAEIKSAFSKLKDEKADFIELNWEEIDECIQFLTYEEAQNYLKEQMGDLYKIRGTFPNEVLLKRKE